MLVSFTLQNWRSFRDANTLNLVATSEKQHKDRVANVSKYDFHLLTTAAIYGGNASGKSNLFKALQFTKWMVTEGPKVKGDIPVEPFRLDDSVKSPSKFSFVLIVQGQDKEDLLYDYSFALDSTKVIDEKLVWIKKASEVVLFERHHKKDCHFHDFIKKDQTLHAVLESTRDNQLFLTNAASQNTSKYKTQQILKVFEWFRRLSCINPATCAIFTPSVSHKINSNLESLFYQFGTGVIRLDFVEESIPEHEIKSLIGDRSEELPVFLKHASGSRFLIERDTSGLHFKRMVSVHQDTAGESVYFDLTDDSDGTVRLIDLFPGFQQAAIQGSQNVFVIDELDRSLHTLLVRQLLASYLASCSEATRSQILFTTHDVLQMDQELLRRDEMWVTDRKKDGSSELIPLSSFKDIRKDKSIRTSYLRGQLGGVPKLLFSGAFGLEKEAEVS